MSTGRLETHEMSKGLVFLVPGFFGFTSLGSVSYFERVECFLAAALARRGYAARVVRCATQPTASIPRRAELLRRQVLRHGGLRADELHFVGHSTGGLDVRMLLTPGVRLRGNVDRNIGERIAERTRSAISVATPNHGTPLASHFLTLDGQTLLLILSGLATSSPGRRTVQAAAAAVALAARLDDWLGRDEGPLDRVAAGLLRRIRADHRDPVWKYLREIERDQGAVLQLTPEGMELFNAAVADRPGVAYVCIAAAAPDPGSQPAGLELADPEYLALRSLFRGLHALASRPHRRYAPPGPDASIRRALRRALGFAPSAASNDGFVPLYSQLHGHLLHAARADHLDLVGHFSLAGGRTADWLPSGAGYTSDDFDRTWNAVADAIAAVPRRRPAQAISDRPRLRA
ncbi:esterase/lipase family protein [Methylibium petroleiphilum]|uniref:esterase/lipase family protein n=1 Tax=Methylibium petroleiphilum TaxID=105560 RepID=UPI001ACA3ED1|nr:hypothetical protein [Methylibium petroleiphilum]MBN9203684.1 hypothetical protein [Methylibium petroleiphilum]